MRKVTAYIFSLVILVTAITGCDTPMENNSDKYDKTTISEIITVESNTEEETVKINNDSDYKYEYYLTREELVSDIENGYAFRLDKTFAEPANPTVTGGSWPFHVYEENTLELKISYSNLIYKENETSEKGFLSNLFQSEPQVSLSLVSPDGKTVYTFEKKGEDIENNISIHEKIHLTPGEWNLKLSFVFASDGEEKPAEFKISAQYENPSQMDIDWLKDNRK